MPRLPPLVAAMAALSCTTAHPRKNPTDKTTLISRQPFEVKIMDDGRDFTAITPAAL